MRQRSRPAAVLGLLVALLAPPARAEDEPRVPRPVPPPRPEIPALLDRLLASDPEVRASADAAVAGASPDVLRILFFALRDRAARAEAAARGATAQGDAPAEPRRSDRGVRQDVRFVSLTAASAARLLDVPAATVDAVHRVLAPAEAEDLLARVAKDPEAREVHHPTITAYDRQKASVEVLDRGSYVADMDVRVQGGALLADPVVRTYVTGLRLESRARILHDGSSIGLSLEVEARRRVGPLLEEALPAKEGLPPLKVQRAELAGCRWSRSFTVPASGTLLVALPPGFSSTDGQRLAVLWTPSIVVLDEGVPGPSSPAGK